jgi:hypothetical protein
VRTLERFNKFRSRLLAAKKLIAAFGRSQSSAELDSAVSRIFNPLAVTEPGGLAKSDTLPKAIRRYSRLQICATSQRGGSEKIFAGKHPMKC